MLENLRHNVSNLHRNNVNIALANYIIKLLKYIHISESIPRGQPLSDPLK